MGGCQDGCATDILWPQCELKRDPPSKEIWNWGKAEISSPLAIYKPHHEKVLFLSFRKGADKLCSFTAGSEPMFICYTDWKSSCFDWNISNDFQSKIKRLVIVSVSTWKMANLWHELQINVYSLRGSYNCLHLNTLWNTCNHVRTAPVIKYTIHVKNWNPIQNAADLGAGYFINVKNTYVCYI